MHILWVRSKIKIFEKENIQDIFHDKLSFLLGKKNHRNENRIFKDSYNVFC